MTIQRTPILNKYGYIYLTTNLINNKTYIGKHCSNEFDAKYYGSGRLILKALKKYGYSNFTIEVLCWANNNDELNELEIRFISVLNAVNSKEYYNLYSGGEGATSEDMMGEKNHRYGIPRTDEWKENHKMALVNSSTWKENHQEQLRVLQEKNEKSGELARLHESNITTGWYQKLHAKHKKPVYQYTLEGVLVERFDGIIDTRKLYGYYVADCCNGKIPKYRGYLWSFLPPEEFKMVN